MSHWTPTYIFIQTIKPVWPHILMWLYNSESDVQEASYPCTIWWICIFSLSLYKLADVILHRYDNTTIVAFAIMFSLMAICLTLI